MALEIGEVVMLPGYAPYPRYGRVAAREADGRVRVAAVHCGDPRCAAEHRHGDQVWPVAALLAAQAYQPRAPWEEGRKSSPNAPVE
jgi:hypothetical protein